VRLKSRNVIGMLPGEGELADEFVVIGAHYDHVGLGGLGSLAPGTREVHNGADDNGSGTVGLLEIARRLTTSLSGPRRSILFMAFTAEERGLLGSNYYVRHPRYPLEKTVAMINLDMVGRLNNDELTVYGTGTAIGFDTLIDDVNASYQFKIDKVPAGLGPSDHSSFYEQRIPVYHFFTGLHNDYHRPSDDFDKINVTGMVRITDMVSQVAMRIATTPERPTYREVRGRANPTQQNARRPQPGRMGIEYSVQERGLIVDRVLAGSGAEKAGIQPGDRLVKIAGIAIDSMNVLLAQMNATRPGDKIAIEIERDGMLMALEVQL
jgi:Zn-dependent M28 family amino/carboxypeptidase